MDCVGIFGEVFVILLSCLSSPKNVSADEYPLGLTTSVYFKLKWLKNKGKFRHWAGKNYQGLGKNSPIAVWNGEIHLP